MTLEKKINVELKENKDEMCSKYFEHKMTDVITKVIEYVDRFNEQSKTKRFFSYGSAKKELSELVDNYNTTFDKFNKEIKYVESIVEKAYKLFSEELPAIIRKTGSTRGNITEERLTAGIETLKDRAYDKTVSDVVDNKYFSDILKAKLNQKVDDFVEQRNSILKNNKNYLMHKKISRKIHGLKYRTPNLKYNLEMLNEKIKENQRSAKGASIPFVKTIKQKYAGLIDEDSQIYISKDKAQYLIDQIKNAKENFESFVLESLITGKDQIEQELKVIPKKIKQLQNVISGIESFQKIQYLDIDNEVQSKDRLLNLNKAVNGFVRYNNSKKKLKGRAQNCKSDPIINKDGLYEAFTNAVALDKKWIDYATNKVKKTLERKDITYREFSDIKFLKSEDNYLDDIPLDTLTSIAKDNFYSWMPDLDSMPSHFVERYDHLLDEIRIGIWEKVKTYGRYNDKTDCCHNASYAKMIGKNIADFLENVGDTSFVRVEYVDPNYMKNEYHDFDLVFSRKSKQYQNKHR